MPHKMNGTAKCSITDDLLFGASEAMQQIHRKMGSIADSGLPVLIEGESGTGKEVLALAIHARSSRSARAFVKINCSAETPLPMLDRVMPEPDSGECTQAGSILFDDIGELPLSAQSKVVALLEDACLSGARDKGTQVLCTTKTTLRPKIETGSFRDDLYYRINVVNLWLPPLRERRADIRALAKHFFDLYTAKYQRDPGPFSERLMDALTTADWPGNIRELENTVKRYITLGSVEMVLADLQQQNVSKASAGDRSFKALKRNAIRDCEYKAILDSLNRNHWNRQKTAIELDISYRSLLYMMQQLGLPRKRSQTTTAGRATEASS